MKKHFLNDYNFFFFVITDTMNSVIYRRLFEQPSDLGCSDAAVTLLVCE